MVNRCFSLFNLTKRKELPLRSCSILIHGKMYNRNTKVKPLLSGHPQEIELLQNITFNVAKIEEDRGGFKQIY